MRVIASNVTIIVRVSKISVSNLNHRHYDIIGVSEIQVRTLNFEENLLVNMKKEERMKECLFLIIFYNFEKH